MVIFHNDFSWAKVFGADLSVYAVTERDDLDELIRQILDLSLEHNRHLGPQ